MAAVLRILTVFELMLLLLLSVVASALEVQAMVVMVTLLGMLLVLLLRLAALMELLLLLLLSVIVLALLREQVVLTVLAHGCLRLQGHARWQREGRYCTVLMHMESSRVSVAQSMLLLLVQLADAVLALSAQAVLKTIGEG